jgi:hypothetical protein
MAESKDVTYDKHIPPARGVTILIIHGHSILSKMLLKVKVDPVLN